MDKPRSMIPQDYMIDMEIHLSTSISWLMEQIDEQDKTVEHLLNVKQDLENQIEELIQDKNNLVYQLSEAKSNPALSAIDRRQLELLGINKVSDLINKYRSLLVQVSEMEADKSRSGLSVSSLKDIVAQPEKVAHIPKIVEPQGGACFSKISDQHDGENDKVEDKREGYRGLGNAKIPQPPTFSGKSRTDLERFFRYFEPYAESLSLDDEGKALLIGYYLPKLQYQHDSLMQRKASYAEVKRELLNSLGSESSVATYTLRANLDKLVKPVDKSYRSFLARVERKVAEAFSSDKNQREQELKKILLRLTQEDPDTSYCSTTLPHTAAGYYRLKELVLGIEDASKMRKQNAKSMLERGSPEKSFSVIDSSQCDLAAEYQDYDTVQQKQAEDGEHQQQRVPAVERQTDENVDWIQAVNVKRPFVSFIGYKPKQTRGYKVAPNRSYASVAAIKTSAASRSVKDTKAIKRCFVCGEIKHVAKDCPLRFVEKGKVDKVTQQYTVGGISFEYADTKDKIDANVELKALPFSASNTVGNDTVTSRAVDSPATKKDKDLSENDSVMPLVNDDAQRRDIFNCIRVNQVETVRDNFIVQLKPYVKQNDLFAIQVLTNFKLLLQVYFINIKEIANSKISL
uniref:CCHC-type domain-containing protein n=1 Tax=Panagrolaimus superbus TaxID=310955 RepID=A0A914YUJ4_9BILA